MGARKKIEGRSRHDVARNVNALVDHRWPNSTNRPKDLAAHLSVSLSQAQRILSGAHGFTLETIETVARAFNLAPWQLLVPGLDPKIPPKLAAPAVDAEKVAHGRSKAKAPALS